MKNVALFTFASLLFLYVFLGNCFVGNQCNVYAQDDWKQEYAVVCAKTQNAMILSSEVLKDYIDRCDKLQERINALDGEKAATEKKVYSKRVKMCRDLYDFALQQKDMKE